MVLGGMGLTVLCGGEGVNGLGGVKGPVGGGERSSGG